MPLWGVFSIERKGAAPCSIALKITSKRLGIPPAKGPTHKEALRYFITVCL